MRRYLAVIRDDLTAPSREWSLRGVGAFVLFVTIAGGAVLIAMAVTAAPWYVLFRFGLGYADDRARELTAGMMIVTWFVIGYAASVFDRAKQRELTHNPEGDADAQSHCHDQ